MSFLRNRVEGLFLLTLFPIWVAVALCEIARGVCTGCRGGFIPFGKGIRRWGSFVVQGGGCYREAWPALFRLEPKGCLLWYLLLTEWFSALNCRGRSTNAVATPPRILLLQFAHLGDALHTRPLFERLRARYGSDHVDLLVSPWLKKLIETWPAGASVYSITPRLIQYNRGGQPSSGWLSWIDLAIKLRKRNYSHVLAANPTSPVEWLAIQAVHPEAWVGTPITLMPCYAGMEAYTDRLDTTQYEADRLIKLGRYLHVSQSAPRLIHQVRQEDGGEIEKMMASSSWSISSPLLVISPGGGRMDRCWPAECYHELLARLSEQFAFTAVIIGTREERGYADAIAGSLSGVINLAGLTSITAAAALIKRAKAFIGNDSGPFHLAVALGTPCVGLFRTSQRARWAPPESSTCLIAEKPFTCEGCVTWHPRGECLHQSACVRGIPVSMVLEKCRTLLAAC